MQARDVTETNARMMIKECVETADQEKRTTKGVKSETMSLRFKVGAYLKTAYDLPTGNSLIKSKNQ